MARWADVAEPERSIGIARDVILVHIGSMSNLFAAAGWMLAQLATHPDVLARVRADEAGLLERCALESTRLGQRSIMLRAVLAPTTVADEHHTYAVPAGAQIATLLPLTNTTAMPGLDAYDPDRWARRRLKDEAELPAREMVTTFGHGAHTCPAQPFSLAAMCASADAVLRRLRGRAPLPRGRAAAGADRRGGPGRGPVRRDLPTPLRLTRLERPRKKSGDGV